MLLQKFIFRYLKYRICICGIFLIFLYSGNVLAQYQASRSPIIIDSLLHVIKITKEDSVKLKALNKLAWEQFCYSRTTGLKKDAEILKYSNEALALSKKVNNREQEGFAMYTKAALLRRDGKFAEALDKYFYILNLSLEIKDMICAGNQYMNIGDMYSIMGNINESLENHKKAVKTFIATGDKAWLGRSYIKLGNIYSGAGMKDEALKSFQQGLELAIQRNDKILMAEGYTSIANLNKNTGNNQAAMKNFMIALDLNEQSGSNCFDCYLGIAYIYYTQAILNKTPSPKESFTEALRHFQKALQIAKITGSKWYLTEAYAGLAKTYQALNDYENALEYTVLQYQAKDSVFSIDAMNKLSIVKMKHDLEIARIEEDARQRIFLTNEMAAREKILNRQKLAQQDLLNQEKSEYEKNLARDKFENESLLMAQKVKHDKSIAAANAAQEKLVAEKKYLNNMMWMGLCFIVITSAFIFLFIRQRNIKRKAIEKAETFHRMAELELQSLRSQLNPHFMFNSLNSIQTLILKEENEKSSSYLSRFSKLLRMLLDNADKPFIELMKEIDFIEMYLQLESLRIPDLKYSITTDPHLNTRQFLIPNMFLQPYIENAIWHGLSHKEKDKQLQIRIFRDNGTVNYEIEDNGVGRKKSEEMKSRFQKMTHISKGMELLSKRIQLLNKEYSSEIRTDITDVIKNNQISGTLVSIKVPVELSVPAVSLS